MTRIQGLLISDILSFKKVSLFPPPAHCGGPWLSSKGTTYTHCFASVQHMLKEIFLNWNNLGSFLGLQYSSLTETKVRKHCFSWNCLNWFMLEGHKVETDTVVVLIAWLYWSGRPCSWFYMLVYCKGHLKLPEEWKELFLYNISYKLLSQRSPRNCYSNYLVVRVYDAFTSVFLTCNGKAVLWFKSSVPIEGAFDFH